MATVGSAFAGTIIPQVVITNNATSGISATNTYTHAFNMGGSAVTINGVDFLAGGENGAGYTTSGFGSTISGNFAEFPNPGDTVATMLNPFRFHNSGNGQTQTLTITGLTSGTIYDARIYYREWAGVFNRHTTIRFDEDGAGALGDSTVINGDATPNAHYLSYQFTATSSQNLVVSFSPAAPNVNASFHVSGFSVHVIPEPSTALLGGLGLLALLRRRR